MILKPPSRSKDASLFHQLFYDCFDNNDSKLDNYCSVLGELDPVLRNYCDDEISTNAILFTAVTERNVKG